MHLRLPHTALPTTILLIALATAAGAGCIDDAACNDDDACTTDRCEAGACVHADVSCLDGDPCTRDACDRLEGCFHLAPDPLEAYRCRGWTASDRFRLVEEILRTYGVARRVRLVRLLEEARHLFKLGSGCPPGAVLLPCGPPKKRLLVRACERVRVVRKIIAKRAGVDIEATVADQILSLMPACPAEEPSSTSARLVS